MRGREARAPAIPSTGSLVLVTSRRRLTGLDTTHAVSLETLPRQDAVALFLRTADRSDLTTETPGVLEVVQLCGWLPLAVRIAAARLKHRRVWTVTDLMVRLREFTRLAALEDGQRSVHATLHLSYQYLSAAAQRLYRPLGLHPGSDVEPYAAAALAAGTVDETRRLLDGLVDDHVLEELSPGRFQFHDLVRAHAVDIVVGQETQEQRHAASTRLLDHYRHTAASAMAVAYPHQRQRRPTVPHALTAIPDLDDRDRSELWLDTELANLLAVTQHAGQNGWPEHAWQLSATLDQHLLTRGRYRDMQALHQHAYNLAHDLGNHQAEVDALIGLGSVERMLGRRDQAADHFGQALRLARAHDGLAHPHYALNRHDQARRHWQHALDILTGLGTDDTEEFQTSAADIRTHLKNLDQQQPTITSA